MRSKRPSARQYVMPVVMKIRSVCEVSTQMLSSTLHKSWITSFIIPVGWLLAGAVTYLARDLWAVATFASFCLLTVCLAVLRSFPRRAAGLASSWLGPLIVSAGILFAESLLEGFSRNGALSVPAIALQASTQLVIGGLIAAIMSAWFFRGFGMISFAAAVAVVWPRYRETAFRAARDYPWRAWWAVPAWLLALTALSAIVALVICKRFL